VVDYYLVKRGRIEVDGLYREGTSSAYWYKGGVNPEALYAFAPAAIISLVFALIPAFGTISPFSWFVGAGIAGGLYWIIARRHGALASPERGESST
jgi:nucleobase:cation symporter-1, NCS1 family